jgi:AbrB family looped-hinge helix DNA binding protein
VPKVTAKLQITIPKRLAEQVGISAGSDVEFAVVGEGIPAGKRAGAELSTAERLRLFHEASARQADRDKRFAGVTSTDREWTREDLYIRGDGGRGEPG